MENYEKKYKDAMGMAEEIIRYYKEHNRGDENSIEDLEGIFPELRESEDETIRKEIIEFVDINTLSVDERHDRWIAWLEKQGEQKPFDYEHATITQKDFACDAEEASYTAEVATGDGSIKTVVSKKVPLPNPQSKEWSEEDENMAEDLIKGLLSSEKVYNLAHTSKEIADWLKSLKDRIGG